MRLAKVSDMRHKVKIYEQVNVRLKSGKLEPRWRYVFSLWCREVPIFREQLQAMVSGATTLRDRREMETHYTKKLNTRHRALFEDKLFQISIVGDTEGNHKRTRFLMEALDDGGA